MEEARSDVRANGTFTLGTPLGTLQDMELS